MKFVIVSVLYFLFFGNTDITAQRGVSPEIIATESGDSLLNLSLEDLLNLDVTIQVASTQGDNIFTSPSTVSIISTEQIEKFNFATVEEALQTLAGVKVYRTYLKRNLPTSRGIIQDHYANKTLVLINGIPLWNAVTGEGNLDRVNINDLERIEVLKGPGSMLYGTNAYAGTINLVLKKENHSTASLYGFYGANNSFQAGGNTFLKSNSFETYISMNSANNQGPNRDWTDERNVTNSLFDHLASDNATINSQYKSHSLMLNAYQQRESFYGVTPSFKAGAGVDQKLKGYCVSYTYNKAFLNKVSFFGGVTYDYNSRNLARDSMNLTRSLIDGNRLRFDLRGNYSFLKDMFSAELGADYDIVESTNYSNYNVAADTITDFSNLRNKQLFEYSVFGQLQFSKNKFKAIAGSRFTNNQLFGTNFSSRASLVYQMSAKSSIKIIFGESYRAPSMFEYYFCQETAVTKSVFGNTALHPEKSTSIEIAYLKSFDNFFIQALLYRAIYDNKILRSNSDTSIVTSTQHTLGYYTTASNKPSIYVNGKSFAAHGLELEMQYSNPKFVNLFANYNFIRGDKGDSIIVFDKAKNPILVYNYRFVSDQTLSLGCSKELFKTMTLSGVYNFMTAMNGPFATIPNQQTLDLNLTIKQKFRLFTISQVLSVKNVFDENILFPEYSRMMNKVNAIPYGTYRFIGYSIKIVI